MYQLKIKTKFNNLELIVDDYHDEEVQDILNQPYIEDVYLCNIDEDKRENYSKVKKLIKQKRDTIQYLF